MLYRAYTVIVAPLSFAAVNKSLRYHRRIVLALWTVTFLVAARWDLTGNSADWHRLTLTPDQLITEGDLMTTFE